MICLTPKPNKSFFVYCIQSKEKMSFTKKKKKKKKRGIFKEKGEQKMKRLFNSSHYSD